MPRLVRSCARGRASGTPRRHDLIAGAADYSIARSSRAMTVLKEHSSLRLQEVRDVEQHELVVVGLVGIAAGRERQIVVVADDDVGFVDTIDVLDGEEREGVDAVIERLLRLLVGVPDLQEVDVADLAHGLADIAVAELDLVDTLELRQVWEAVLAAAALRAGLVGRAFAVVALDDQAARRVDHVEVADGIAVLLEHILPVAAGEFFRGDVEFEDARGFLAVDLLPVLLLGIPERPLEQAVEKLAVFRGSEALITLGASEVDVAVGRTRRARGRHRPMIRRAHRLAVGDRLEYG